jgi:hypothetical protein
LNSGAGSLPVAVQDAVLSAFLGLGPNTISNAFTNTTEGSVLFQTFQSGSGQTGLTFDWNFMTNEFLNNATFNDVAFAMIFDGAGNLVNSAFLDTFSTFTSSGTLFTDHTGWVGQSFTNLNPNTTYSLVFGVFDREDGVVDSGLLIDNIASIPEPTVGLFGLLLVAGAAATRRRS